MVYHGNPICISYVFHIYMIRCGWLGYSKGIESTDGRVGNSEIQRTYRRVGNTTTGKWKKIELSNIQLSNVVFETH